MELRPALLLLCLCVPDVLLTVVPVSNVKTSIHTVNKDFNNSVTVTCTAEGTSPTFRWFNGSVEIRGDGERIHVSQMENSGTLIFSPIYRVDLAAPTLCEASNGVSKARSGIFSLVLTVADSLKISPEAPPRFVASQSDFRLTCTPPSSEPVSGYVWFADGSPMKTTGPTLTVKDIEREGRGTTRSLYTCNATKSVGSMPVAFTIIKAISAVKMSAPQGKLVAGRSSANLSCWESSGEMVKVRWLKDGAALSPGGRVVIAPDNRSVLIAPLRKEDNALFSCHFNNPVSQVEEQARLTVFYGPEPVVLSGLSQVKVDSPLKLECSAPSLPAANLTWRFNGAETAVKTSEYIIDKAKFSSTGEYSCEATNAETGGTSSKSLSVRVESPGLSGGAIAGIVIAVVAAVALVLGLFVYFWKKKNNQL